jgi:hypothetical protein
MSEVEIRPICQHLGTKVHYEFLGGNKFRNIVTGQTGEVDEEKAAKVFSFSPELTDCVNSNPAVLDLLKIGFREI